jgi:pyruvate/2-oxoglutarate dehydrogenase complex dihydrolipoamide acyltransferase (E2) component
MPRKNESIVFFEQLIDLSRTSPWIDEFNGKGEARISVFHVVLAAIATTLHERPRLNRFVSGRSVYQRHGVWMSFAVKKGMDDDAPLSTVKREFPEDESFGAFVRSLSGNIELARSNKKSRVDKELKLAFKLPAPVLGVGLRLLDALDRRNLAPRSLLADDPMYTSAFVANLGSLKIDAAYHHLYEHGNCPLFVTVGKVEKRPMVIDGEVVARESVQLRYSYDERIEDGFYCATSIRRIEELVSDPTSWCRE